MSIESELIKIIKGDKKKDSPYDTSAEVVRVEDDIVWVHIAGGVDETPVQKTVDAKRGDTVQVRVSKGNAFLVGNNSRPPTDDSTANYAVNIANETNVKVTEVENYVAGEIDAQKAVIGDLEADTAKIHNLTAEQLSATVGYVGDLTTGNVTASDIISDHADVGTLKTTKADVSDLNATNAEIETLKTTKANVSDLNATNAEITNLKTSKADVTALNAEKARIDDLEADHVSTADLQATNAEITDLKANKANVTDLNASNARITNLESTKADVSYLEANYAEIDLANVNNAWIEDGVIKDAAISDAQIIGVSANKLTAGTIDASNITVTNLNASNITAGAITVDGITIDVTNNEASIDGNYIEDGTITLNGLAQEVTDKIDGAIETFTGTAVPTLNNYPASSWTTAKVRATHVGDVYYVINANNQADGYCYRFAYDNTTTTYGWVLIKDSDVTAALQRLTTAEGDIDGLQTFESETSSWITETDEELSSLKTRTTTVEGVAAKSVKSSVQLWYSKADTAAPNKPTSKVTSTSTAGNAWRTVVPAYNASYPNYFYCWQYEYSDGTYGWSAVVRDIAMGETQSTSRSAQSTANANVKSTTMLWFTKANTTAPNKPTAHVTSTDTAGNAWRVVVPTYNSSYPYYFYCYEYQHGDNTYTWSDVVYDRATSESQANSQDALSQVATKVESSVFNEVKQTVDENSASITSLTTITENNGLTSSTNISNTVNSISQKADSNQSKISNLTTLLKTNADGTTASTDIVHQVSQLDQDLDGITTRVGKTEVQILGQYATSTTAKGTAAKVATITPAVSDWKLYTGATITVKFTNENTASAPTLNINSTGAKAIKTYANANLSEAEYKWKAGSTFTFTYNGTNWLMQDSSMSTRMSSAESSITQNADNINLKVSKDGVISSINQSAETVKIQASKVEIDGTAIFNAISEDIDDAITNKGYQTSSQVESAITSKGYQTATDVSNAISTGISGKADKTAAIAEEQRIYYRSNVSTKPNGAGLPTSWVTETGDKYNTNATTATGWSRKVTPIANGTGASVTKYLYLWTCIQKKTVSGTVTYGDIMLDDSTTVIDGGKIVTGSLNANHIGAGDISADRMQVNSISAINGNTGTVKIKASKVEIDGTAVFSAISGKVDEAITDKGYATTAELPTKVSDLTNDSKFQTEGQVSTAVTNGVKNKADKTDAVGRTQRIYYRKTSSGAPAKNTTWLATSGTGYGNWSLKVPQLTNGTTKYPYLYTAVQTQTVSQMSGTACSCSDVLLDDTATIIDGGTIITGTVNANAINASSGTFDTANIPNLDANKITTGDILADRMKVNSISAINGNTGTVKIKASKVEIDGTTTFNAIKSQADAAYTTKTEFNNLEIGGRNLLPWSTPSAENLVKISYSNETNSFVTEDGYPCYKITGASTSGRQYASYNNLSLVKLKANTQYTYSAWVKVTTTASGVTDVDLHFTSLGHFTVYNGLSTLSDRSHEDVASLRLYSPSSVHIGTWTKITLTFTTNSLDGSTFGVYPKHALGSDYTLFIRGQKLEKGNKATDWTPAPEDVQAEIDAKKSIHTVMATGVDESYGFAQILAYSKYTTLLNWTVTSVDGIQIGDTVRVGVKASNMNNTVVYVVMEVTNVVPLSNKIIGYPKGLDTTIIDGGSIITNSIGADKIKTSELTIGQSQVTNLTTDLANTQKLYSHTVDLSASSYDQDTWYPVLIPNNEKSYVFFKCSFYGAGGSPNWSTHNTKHWSCDVEAYYVISAWGWGQTSYSYINTYCFGWVDSIKPVVLSNALSNTTKLVVYLRGGAIYPIKTSSPNTPEIKTSSYTENSQTVEPTTTQPVNSDVFVVSRRQTDTNVKESAKTATSYITHIDNAGITVHPSGTTDNRVGINADGMEVFKDNKSVAFYGDTARVGEGDSSHIEIYGNAITGVSSSGNNFFEVNEKGGATTTNVWVSLSRTRHEDATVYNLSTSFASRWNSINNGENFYIEVYIWESYTKQTTGETGYIVDFSRKLTFTKGTSSSQGGLATYDASNSTVTINHTTTSSTYAGHTETFGYVATTNGSLYRFGSDVAETGGANGFMMGTGTLAAGRNQLAIGSYNESDSNSYFIIGNGTSDSTRETVFKISRSGAIYPHNIQMDDFVIDEIDDGIWTYRKWFNGYVDCWANVTGPWSVNFTQQTTGINSDATWRAKAESLPTGLFTAVDYANVSIQTSGYTCTQVCTITTSAVTFRAWNPYPVNGMTIYSYSLYVKGRWR